jgi:hypothetical protein
MEIVKIEKRVAVAIPQTQKGSVTKTSYELLEVNSTFVFKYLSNPKRRFEKNGC